MYSFIAIKNRIFFTLLFSFILVFSAFTSNSEARRIPKRNIQFKIDGNTIKASEIERVIERWYPRIQYGYVEKELWQTTFPSLKNTGKLYGPTSEIDNKVYFGYLSFIMELDKQRMQFTNRYQILGEITGLKIEDGKLVIDTFNGIRGKVWDKEQTIRVTPEQLANVATYGTMTNRDYLTLYAKRKDAELLSTSIERVEIQTLLDDKYTNEQLEEIRQEYIDAADIDTTNPWYYIYLGLISRDLDKKVYSEIYFKKALETKGLVFYDLFQLSTFYAYIEKKDLADKAFDRGMSDFLGRGYTPEQLTSLESLLNYTTWLVPTIKSQKNKAPEQTIELMDKYYKLSPLKEGNYNISDGVAKYLISLGKLPEARDWQIRADKSKGYFFPGDYSVIVADISLNMFIACMLAFLIFAAIHIIADMSEFIEDERHNRVSFKEFFKRRYVSKRSIFSFVLLYLLSLGALGVCVNSVSVMSQMVKEPATINSGTWGNYATVKYFTKDLKRKRETNFFMAIANHQLKDYETAIKQYKTSDTSEAHNNIGTIYMKQGKKDLALEQLNRAAKLNPYAIEPKYNLALLEGKFLRFQNEKADFYQKYSPTTPMLAMPSDKYYREVYYKSLRLQDFNPANVLMFNNFLSNKEHDLVNWAKLIVPVFIIFTVLLILMLVSIFIPQTKVTSLNNSYLRRLLGMFIPGVAYNWKLLGPIVFALWAGLGITTLFYFSYGFEDAKPAMGIITTYSLPDYSALSPFQSFELAFSREIGFVCGLFYVVIWIFNFFYILISRRFMPT